MKILVIGGAGLLGHRLLLSAKARKFEAHGTFKDVKLDYTWAKWHEADVADEAGTLAVLDEVKPDAVIFTAAFHKVDACEDNKTLCYDINVRAPLYVAKWCRENSSRFVFISTDYVFSGERDGRYSETDEPAPASFYALCKRFTEQVLLSDPAGRLVVRTGVIYGHHPKKSNFVSWLISEVKAGKAVRIFDDQSNCPTLANDLAEAILRLLEKKSEGLFHTTGSECLNRYEFALKIKKGPRGFVINVRHGIYFVGMIGRIAHNPPQCLVVFLQQALYEFRNSLCRRPALAGSMLQKIGQTGQTLIFFA